MDARKVFADVVDLCNESDACPHETLEHITRHDGVTDVESAALAMAEGLVARGTALMVPEGQILAALAHVVTMVLATGYAIGASDAYDIVLSSDVDVPDTLAALDLIGPAFGDRPEDN